jgi:transcriptional regulator with XRE-family HTH domain
MTALAHLLDPELGRFTLAEIAHAAEIDPAYLSNLRAGRKNPGPRTIARLRHAIARLKQRCTEGPSADVVAYRAVLAISAKALNLDAKEVLASDPHARKAACKGWRDACLARWLAQALLNSGLNIRQADVARASGVTRQAVSLAMREIENRRSEPAFDALVTELEDCLKATPP